MSQCAADCLVTALLMTALTVLSGCATRTSLVVHDRIGPQRPAVARRSAGGELLVYSATYAATLEQSEYPVHTNYTIATPDDKVIERVRNEAGSFYANPMSVELPPGEYRVCAQYDRGGFVTVPVVIEQGKTTLVDLDG